MKTSKQNRKAKRNQRIAAVIVIILVAATIIPLVASAFV